MLSIIIPVYNENENVVSISKVIDKMLSDKGLDYEIIFVDDGSTDSSWQIISSISEQDGKIKGLSFSRNFGKESAIYAGLKESVGDCAVVLDCDLQHPPEYILEMYELWESGYEIVEGIKKSRGCEGVLHRVLTKCFYACISGACGKRMDNTSDYKLLDRKAINAILDIQEQASFFRALTMWIGFKTTRIYYDVRERTNGKSKWSKLKLIRYAVSNITSFTSIPLHVITFLGVTTVVLGTVLSIITIYRYLIHESVEGFSTVIIMQCYSSGVIMVGIGIVGYYLSRIFDEIRKRPRYIISKKTY